MKTEWLSEMTEHALNGTMNFGAIIGALMREGVESYHTDFVRKENTYYMPDGATHVSNLRFSNSPLAEPFDAIKIQTAIRASQRGELKFIDFIPRVMSAGVTGYIVFLTGRKVIYFGRKGETHTELFPA